MELNITDSNYFSGEKMNSYVSLFLKTEITCIPHIITKYFGDYYNNAICNGATWVFVLWCILHGTFDKLLEVNILSLFVINQSKY